MIEAFASWGSFDLDDPFPLFAEARKLGAVHPVTLGRWSRRMARRPIRGGHGRAQRPRGSPRTCTPPWRRVRKSLPRGCRDRISPGTCSRWIRPTTPGFVGSFLLLSPRGASRPCAHRSRRITDDLLDAIAERGPDSKCRSRLSLCVPTAVHGHLRTPRRTACGQGSAWPRVHQAARADLDRLRVRRGQGGLGCGRGDAPRPGSCARRPLPATISSVHSSEPETAMTASTAGSCSRPSSS